MTIDKVQINLFNYLKEIVYIYDYRKDEIIFLNNIALNVIGNDSKIPINIEKCSKELKDSFFNRNILKDNNNRFISYNKNKYEIIKTQAIYNGNEVILCMCIIEDLKNTNKPLRKKNILMEGVEALAGAEDLFQGIYKILEILGYYYGADNIYMGEAITEDIENIYVHKWNKKTNIPMSNSIESNENLIKWGYILGKKDLLFIDNINDISEKWPEKYAELRAKNVENFVVATIKFLDAPIGYILIENIDNTNQDFNAISSLIYFILNEIKRKQVSKKLSFMSHYDELTGINNEGKYMKYLSNLRNNKIERIGVVFIDINGLTKLNDNVGEPYGNRAIIEVANALKNNFRKEDLYRIDGDKFIVIATNIDKEVFYNKVNKINTYFLDLREYSISIGYIWEKVSIDIENTIRLADKYMEHAKGNYYKAIEKYNIEIFSSMATRSEADKDKLKVVIGHDTSLDFQNYKAYFQPKQEIFNFKVKQLIKDNMDKKFILVMLDINNFKAINEMYGFDEGNKILFNIGNAINKVILYKGVSCHIHSDLYYFFYEASNEDEILSVLSRIETAINKCVHNIRVNLSYGIYRLKQSDMEDIDIDIDEICKRASYAHKISKRDGIKNVTFYGKILKDTMVYKKELEDDMEGALKNGEFKMYLQPKYDIKTETIAGAEALVRWEHSRRGLIYPNAFIDLFEKNGFILKVDMYILEQACKFLKKNKEEGKYDIPISVNMSKLHFKDDNFVDNVLSIIRKYKISPELIEIEITESLLAEDQEYIIKIIEILKSNNLSISLDDFGSGYSSFGILKVLPVDILKIDYTFFKDFKKSTKGSAIIRSIVMLAKELNLKTVAEGVENKEEVDYLREVQCDMIQGYYYSKPITLKEFIKKAFGE